ncbi:hypothetical protein SLS53_004046 [Cytospora paraplurivora]|uniref:Uncharacterized protein n=1 Tax=Cytospora paraplurivora TaxID=2898453 RepID=A0AAN9U964_9PEZI
MESPPRQGIEPTATVPGTTVTADLRPDEEDRLLDEILDGLDVEDDQWSLSNDDEEDSKRVEQLLARLRDDPEARPPKSPEAKAKDPAKDPDSDDSEGEEITREVDNVISKALDELKLDGPAKPTEQAQDQPSWPLGPGVEVKTNRAPKVGSDGHDDGNNDIALPDVSQDVHDRDGAPIPLSRTPAGSDDDDETGLDLPTVPTALVDPAPPAEAPASTFESSIESRLAALKGEPPVQTDMFGLPSAPTFQPEDHPVPGVIKKPGYTDEDQKTWCIVCLEDATVRCLGCEGDVYCARCWREYHVGPSAGYDERGHQWEKFDQRQL